MRRKRLMRVKMFMMTHITHTQLPYPPQGEGGVPQPLAQHIHVVAALHNTGSMSLLSRTELSYL